MQPILVDRSKLVTQSPVEIFNDLRIAFTRTPFRTVERQEPTWSLRYPWDTLSPGDSRMAACSGYFVRNGYSCRTVRCSQGKRKHARPNTVRPRLTE